MTNSPVAKSLSSIVRWRIVIFLMGFAALGHLNRLAITVAGSEVFIEPKGPINPTDMGWVYTSMLIAYTLCMMPGGWLIDRFGAGRMMTMFGLTMGTCAALTGTVGWFTSTTSSLWLGLIIIRSFTGACSAPLHPGAAHAVSDIISDRRQATANGMVTAGALIGVAFCYPIFGWLIDRWHWPLAFIIGGLALIAYTLLWKYLAAPDLSHGKSTTAGNAHKADSPAIWPVLRMGNLWLITLSYAAYGYFQYLFFYWMGYYFEEILHVPALDTRRATFYIFLAMGSGMVIGGMSTDAVCKRLGRIWGRRSIVLTGMGLASLFVLLALLVKKQEYVTGCLAVSMAALGMCEGVFWTTATDIGGKSRGFTGAFMNCGGNVGGLISPTLTPYIADKVGWTGAIVVACVISFFGGAVWFFIKLPPAASSVALPQE